MREALGRLGVSSTSCEDVVVFLRVDDPWYETRTLWGRLLGRWLKPGMVFLEPEEWK